MCGLQLTHRDEGDDTKVARRTFKHRCALMRAVLIPHNGKNNVVVLFLDGHPIAELWLSEVAIVISPELDSGPTVDIIFRGDGPRYGDLVNMRHLSAVLTFNSPEQIRTFIEVSPSTGGNQKVGIVPVGGSDGSMLAFAVGAAIAGDSCGDGICGD
jgi:prepilin-type processing-associated H-X9-DG protein